MSKNEHYRNAEVIASNIDPRGAVRNWLSERQYFDQAAKKLNIEVSTSMTREELNKIESEALKIAEQNDDTTGHYTYFAFSNGEDRKGYACTKRSRENYAWFQTNGLSDGIFKHVNNQYYSLDEMGNLLDEYGLYILNIKENAKKKVASEEKNIEKINSNIEKNTNNLKDENNKLNDKKNKASESEKVLEEAKTKLSLLEKEKNELEKNVSIAKEAVLEKENNLLNAKKVDEENKKKLDNEIESLNSAIEKKEKSVESLEKEKNNVKEKENNVKEKEEEYNNLTVDEETLLEKIKVAKEKTNVATKKVSEKEADISNLKKKVAEAEAKLDDANKKKRENDNKISEIEKENKDIEESKKLNLELIESLNKAIEENKIKLKEAKREKEAADNDLSDAADKVLKAEKTLKDAIANKKEIEEVINSLPEKIEGLKGDISDKKDLIDKLKLVANKNKEEADKKLEKALEEVKTLLERLNEAKKIKEVKAAEVDRIETNLTVAKKNLEKINLAKENAASILKENKDKAKKEIDSLINLTDEEKLSAKEKIDNAKEVAELEKEVKETKDFHQRIKSVSLTSGDVEVTTMAVDGDAKLVVKDNGNNISVELKNSLGKDKEVIKNLDVEVVGGKIRGEVLITFTLGEKHEGEEVIVKHLTHDGEIESIKGKVKNGKVTVKLKSLSPVLVARKKIKEDKTDKTDKTVKTVKKQTIKKTPNKKTPNTGDNASFAGGLVSMIGSAFIGFGILKKKKKEYN